MDYMNHNLKCLHNNRIVESFEWIKKWLHKWIQQRNQLLLQTYNLTRPLIIFISLQDKPFLIKCFLQTLKTKVCKHPSTNFLCFPVTSKLRSLSPFYLDFMSFKH